jgi:hypothetical protein
LEWFFARCGGLRERKSNGSSKIETSGAPSGRTGSPGSIFVSRNSLNQAGFYCFILISTYRIVAKPAHSGAVMAVGDLLRQLNSRTLGNELCGGAAPVGM